MKYILFAKIALLLVVVSCSPSINKQVTSTNSIVQNYDNFVKVFEKDCKPNKEQSVETFTRVSNLPQLKGKQSKVLDNLNQSNLISAEIKIKSLKGRIIIDQNGNACISYIEDEKMSKINYAGITEVIEKEKWTPPTHMNRTVVFQQNIYLTIKGNEFVSMKFEPLKMPKRY